MTAPLNIMNLPLEGDDDSNPEDWNRIMDDDSATETLQIDNRVVIHIDIDCFYAQAETIMNPDLQGKMIGVQQKNLVITTNYPARRAGIPKTGFVVELKQRYPELILVNGEDLQHYRRFSRRVFDLLNRLSGPKCPVERLGMDENFIDISEMVTERLRSDPSRSFQPVGHVYGDTESALDERLLIGSLIAKEFRDALRDEVGLSSSAGIAHNKVLAKLVGSTHKPNDQTILPKTQTDNLMLSLKSIRSIPGVGSATYHVLKDQLGIESIADMRGASLDKLLNELDEETAKRVKDLSFGIDPSEVKKSGQVQTLGLEDRFKKITTEEECSQKFSWLLGRLSHLLSEDGRVPQTLKVSTRDVIKEKTVGRRFYKESRQCKVGPSLFNDLKTSPELSEHSTQALVRICLGLLNKMIDFRKEVHISLLGLSVCDFVAQPNDMKDIKSFFTAKSNLKRNRIEGEGAEENRSKSARKEDDIVRQTLRPAVKEPPSGETKITSTATVDSIPHGWDREVFQSLPLELREELLREAQGQRQRPEPKCQQSSTSKTPTRNSIMRYFNKS